MLRLVFWCSYIGFLYELVRKLKLEDFLIEDFRIGIEYSIEVFKD